MQKVMLITLCPFVNVNSTFSETFKVLRYLIMSQYRQFQIKIISPITGPRCPEVSRKLRFPDYVKMALNSGKVVSFTHRPPLPPGNTPGTHFCQRLGRPQGHSAIQRHHLESNQRPSDLQRSNLTSVLQRSSQTISNEIKYVLRLTQILFYFILSKVSYWFRPDQAITRPTFIKT